jgi:hypothetical protein
VGANFALGPALRIEANEHDAGAGVGGCNVMETGRPEWTPMPETVARAPSVVCLPAFMSPSRNPFGDRTARRGPLVTGIALRGSWDLFCCFAGNR